MKEVYDEYYKFVNSNDLYNGYSDYERDYFNILMLNEERVKGIEEGIEKGKKEQQISIAGNLKKSGIDIKIISENTGLSIEEIEKL